MGALGNKEIMSRNLKYYIEKSGRDRRELADIWGFPYSTVSEWINGRKYPRIDKIEIMADYFGIKKSDLVEDKEQEERNIKNSDAMADITVRLFEDEDFFYMVNFIKDLDEKQFKRVQVSLHNLFEERFEIKED
jgi:transcriptional regulator with XRE-family HTH domain